MSKKVKVEDVVQTVEFPIAGDYVEWGLWETVRELVQNAQDAHDLGFEMQIGLTDDGVLSLVNVGAKIERKHLVLGGTSKRDNPNQRGTFGEGFKLAWCSLLRLGHAVSMVSWDELYEPRLEHSDVFQLDVMKLNITKKAETFDGVVVKIGGISVEDWDRIKERLLFLAPPVGRVATSDRNRVLLSEQYAGCLYVGGIFVTMMSSKYRWGYDLWNVALDRDRRVVDNHVLAYSIRELLKKVVTIGQVTAAEVFEQIELESSESDVFKYDYSYDTASSEFYASMKLLFEEKYGKDAVPVANTSESKDVKHLGLKGVIVHEAMRNVVERGIGKSLADHKADRKLLVQKLYGWHELDDTEQSNLEWAVLLVGLERPNVKLDLVTVCDFADAKNLGLMKEGKILLAHKLLADRKELLITLVHEAAHLNGDSDGSVEHETAQEYLWYAMFKRATSN